MLANYALIVAGCVFAFVGLMHLIRVLFKVEITIGGKVFPLWMSIVGFIIPLLLCIWMFLAVSTFG